MENDKETHSLVKIMDDGDTPKRHNTHINCDVGIQLLRCDDEDCKCLKVHCPFCDVHHFKPSASMRVRDHITQSHFKYSVTMGDTLILKCFHKCVNTPGHFHCVFCDQQLYKRKAFVHHLKTHLKKMGKDENIVHFFYNNQPTMINFDGVAIELCTDACEDTLGQHYHCPICKKSNFATMGVMVIHMWRCQDRNKYRRRLPWLQNTDEYLHNDKYLPALQEILGDKWHCSIVRNLDDLPVVQCCLDECCNKKFHCSLCLTANFQPALCSELELHYNSHWNSRVTYLDYSVLVCYLDCEVKNKGQDISIQGHYHCPLCGQTRTSKQSLVNHLPKCAKGDNSLEVEPEEPPVEEDSFFCQDEDLSLTTVEGIKNSPRDSPVNDVSVCGDTFDCNRVAEEVVLPKTEIEMFATITAVLSKEMITRLENRSNETITDILDNVTRQSGSQWTWSPGTQERVYALTGDLENLQEAKLRLTQKLNSQDDKEVQPNKKVSSEVSSTFKSSVSTQTDILFNDSLKMDTVESRHAPIDDDATPGTITDDAIHLEEPNIGESNALDVTTEIKEHRKTRKRKHFKPIDEKVILKKKPGRPRNSSLGCKEEQDDRKVPINADAKRVSSSIRMLSRVSSSPYSKRKPIPDVLKPVNHGPSISDLQLRGKEKQKTNSRKNIKHLETNLTKVVSRYETRGKKVNFSLLATGKDKKVTKLSKKEMLNKSVDNKKTKSKELSVSLVDINEPKKDLIPKQHDELVNESDEELENWEDDSDNDPDFVLDSKRKVSDSDDDSLADANEMRTGRNSVKTKGNKFNKRKGTNVHTKSQKMSDSDDDNVADDKEMRKGKNSIKTEMNVKEKRIKKLQAKSQIFHVPQITIPFVALHQSVQRLRNSDVPENTDYITDVEDEANLKCSSCGFTGQSSADLMDHMIGIHKFDPLHPCSVCGKKFVTHQSRSLHLNSMQCKTKLFRCLKCSFTSRQFADVTDHLIEEHNVVNPMRCDVCEKRLVDKHKHLRKSHFPKNQSMSKDDWACQFCEFMSDQFADVTDHLIQSHEVVDPLRCDVCEVVFKQSKAYHMKLKHGPLDKYFYDKATSCLLCLTTFELFSDLTQHIIEEHNLDNVRCDVCEIIFKSTVSLCDHVDKMHGPSDIHCCNICGRGFNTVYALRKHKQIIHHIHTKLLKSCKKCNFKSNSKKELRLHAETHTVHNECPICHKILAKNTNLMIHIDTMHTKQQECVCNICGKTFRHPRYLRLHLGRHTGIKPHVCSVCGKRFYASNTLHSHMEVHKLPSERTYRHVCSVCGRGFNGKTNLDDHMNKHTGAKPHSCPLCGIKFGFRSMLYKHHQFVHSDLRPYPCSVCSKSYKSKQRLTAHMVSHTGISKFNCYQCKRAFSTSSTLKHHIPRCRGEKPKQYSSSKDNILQTMNTNNEIVIQLVNGEEGLVKIEPLEHNNVVQIVEEISEVVEEVNTGDQISQVFLCSVCATTFQTYEEAERHIATDHAEPEPERQTFEPIQTSVVPKQEVFDYW